MSIFQVNYTNVGQQVLPPDKRGSNMMAWVAALLSPIQYLHNLRMGSYKFGDHSAPYLISTTYSKGTFVLYKYAIYESLVNGNIGNDPLNTTYWAKVLDNFIGVDERVLYNGNVLILTYALNKYFGTVFRQPNNVSDIFITVNSKPVPPFVVGDSENNSSKVYANTSSEFVINAYTFADYTNMTIWVPQAVYDALDTDPANREKIIRNFSDKYIIAGITYLVDTY